MNSLYIKAKLMEYYRFNRQCLCADEVGYGIPDSYSCYNKQYLADIIVLTKTDFIHEIEIKCSKQDLIYAELKKSKHATVNEKYSPNYYSFAVPTELIEEAALLIEKINPKYGLIEIQNDSYSPILIRKTAKLLHSNKEK